jgi:hypothetical protein
MNGQDEGQREQALDAPPSMAYLECGCPYIHADHVCSFNVGRVLAFCHPPTASRDRPRPRRWTS